MDFKKLKSGSDVRGIAVGDHAVLTAETARILGYVFAKRLSEIKNSPVSKINVALGRDSRVSGELLLNAAAEGIAAAGATAVDYGMCTTPAMYMAVLTEGFTPDGSIMITASHHPWNLNGLKFFEQDGGIGFDELDLLLDAAQNCTCSDWKANGKLIHTPFLPTYQKHLESIMISTINPNVQKPLSGLHVVVDAGNGAGGFYAKMLEHLGANIEGSQFLEPDGTFPNHIPNPENQQAMVSVSNAVFESKADLGVIFDADCDRAAIVDQNGKEINRNRLIALISAILLKNKSGATIVTDSVTSSGLADFITAHGGIHYRYKRGYRNVIDEAIRLNQLGMDCPLAIETSGHAALRDNHFLDDGMYLVTLLIAEAMLMKQKGQALSGLIDSLKEPVESTEIRLPVMESDFAPCARGLIDYILHYANSHPDWHVAPDNREGVRVSFDINGKANAAWFLLRLSVHDPVMPLNAESDVEGGVRYVLTKLADALWETNGVDLTPLKKAVE